MTGPGAAVLASAVGKGKGKGCGPPPPKTIERPKPAPEQVPLKVKVRNDDTPLQATPFTIITRVDGTRELHRPDGSVEKAGTGLQDQDGQWGVLDERGALGLDGGEVTEEPSMQESTTGAMEELVAKIPKLREYARDFYDTGLPLRVLRMRISGELGSQVADAFAAAAGDKPVKLEEEPDELQGDSAAKHGRLGESSWQAPKLAVRCADIARPGYNSSAAHEYLDVDEVLQKKVQLLASLIRKAKRCVLYAGAGLSTAAGIGDYATRTGNTGVLVQAAGKQMPKPVSPYSAKPSLGHHGIAALAQHGFVWRFIQQNHDGLPQKAGVPQGLINEIHGGWFDPSNPVVAMSGNLREDLFSDLLECERKADLVLAVGSSLCGMNSDRLVSTCASRARRSVPSDPVFGSVIIALQRTPHDANSSVRIFATIDRVFQMLAEELSLNIGNASDQDSFTIPEMYLPLGHSEHVFSVPYDKDGKLIQDMEHRTILDLRDNAKAVIAVGKNRGQSARVLGRNADGHYRIALTHNDDANWNEVRLLGKWWPAAAVAGEVQQIPLASTSPS
jgi:hypothetical protein